MRRHPLAAERGWQRLGQVLPAVLGDQPDNRAGLIFTLGRNWPRLLGEPASQHTFPLEIKEDVLTIGVTDNTWLSELRFYRDDLKRKIGDFIAPLQLKDIGFRLSLRETGHLDQVTAGQVCRRCGAVSPGSGESELCPICQAQDRALTLARIKRFLREAPWASHALAVKSLGQHPVSDFQTARRQLLDQLTRRLKQTTKKHDRQTESRLRQDLLTYVCLTWQKRPDEVSDKFLAEKLPAGFLKLYQKGGQTKQRGK